MYKGAAVCSTPGDSPTCAPPASGYPCQKGQIGNLMRTADSPSRIPADSPSKFQIVHSQSEIYDIGTEILLLQ